MNNGRVALVRIAVGSIVVSGFFGVCQAQDFGDLAEDQHRVVVWCMEDTSSEFCDMVEWQIQKQFPIASGTDPQSYAVLVGAPEVTVDAKTPLYLASAIVTRTVVYKNLQGGDFKRANSFLRFFIESSTRVNLWNRPRILPTEWFGASKQTSKK